MPLFDQYLIVDWSANNQPKTGKDSIWLCLVERVTLRFVAVENPATRTQAVQRIEAIIRAAMDAGKRLFCGFDFAFGYAKGAAQAIAGKPHWRALWQTLAVLVEDDADNRSNRFDVAAQLNRDCYAACDGPFWGHPAQHADRYCGLSMRKPAFTQVPERRLCEAAIPRAKSNWQLFGNGSVGSQTLLGLAALSKLLDRNTESISVWPFETGFSASRRDKPVVFAEIYPSAFTVDQTAHAINDACQVMTLARGFAALDKLDLFERYFQEPPLLSAQDKTAVLTEEGWILGLENRVNDLQNAVHALEGSQ